MNESTIIEIMKASVAIMELHNIGNCTISPLIIKSAIKIACANDKDIDDIIYNRDVLLEKYLIKKLNLSNIVNNKHIIPPYFDYYNMLATNYLNDNAPNLIISHNSIIYLCGAANTI